VNWSDFFSFRQMDTPVIIQVLFWLGIAVSVIGGLAAIASDAPVLGLTWILVGPLIVRVYCELLIVVFKIHDSLRAIERNKAAPSAAPGP